MSAAASGSTSCDVFISYARSESKGEAEALRDALDAKLGAGRTYLDTRDAPIDERFPDDIRKALLGSRVVVAFVGEMYFRKWWCQKEWHLALAPYSRGRHASREARALALRHLVIALPTPDMSEAEWRLLPPDAQVRTTERAANTQGVVELVLCRLSEATATLGEKLTAAGVLAEVEDAFGAEEGIPPARPTNLLRQYPISFGASLQKQFVGRADDLWRVHTLLVAGSAPEEFAPTSVAVRAFAGVGKSTIAREYVHRFGPTHFQGGLFWIDASQSGGSIVGQHHGIWKAIEPDAPPLAELEEALKDPQRVAAEIAARLARAFHSVPAQQRVLVVVDNVPEDTAGRTELSAWCPAPEKVSLLATSRSAVPGVHEKIDLGVLDRPAAVALLARHVRRSELSEDGWHTIVEWVGRVPQPLVLLSDSLGKGVLLPKELLRHAEGSGAISVLDEQVAALEGLVPEESRRGIAEAFRLSHSLLPEDARRAALLLAWFAPAPVPDVLVDAVLATIGAAPPGRTRAVLQDRSFISRDGSPPGWRMHRLLAEFLRSGEDVASRWLEAAEAAASVLTDDRCKDHRLRDENVPCVPPVLRLVQQRPDVATEALDRAGAALHELGSALYELGLICESRDALEVAVEAYRSALEVRTRDRVPLEWAVTQDNLGNALWVLGQREEGTARLEEAVTAYRSALEVRARDRVPLDWAMTQNNLGNVLRVLGGREEGTARLEEALEAFRSALEVYTRDGMPLDWAATQSSLGRVLQALGSRRGMLSELEEAMWSLRSAADGYRSALDVVLRECAPQQWAMAQSNLGAVLELLGRDRRTPARQACMEEAVKANRSALDVYTRESAPLQWALAQHNLGYALRSLDESEGGTSRLEDAVSAFRSALEVHTREQLPVRWVATQFGLAGVLLLLGKRQNGTEQLKEALSAYRSVLTALQITTPRVVPSLQREIGRIEAMISERCSTP